MPAISGIFGALPDGESLDDAVRARQYVRTLIQHNVAPLPVAPGGKLPLDLRTKANIAEDEENWAKYLSDHPGIPDHGVPGGGGWGLATTDYKRFSGYITRYFKKATEPLNLGIEPRRSLVLVVDTDTAEEDAAFKDWAVRRSGDPHWATMKPTVTTPGKRDAQGNWLHQGGGHYYFSIPVADPDSKPGTGTGATVSISYDELPAVLTVHNDQGPVPQGKFSVYIKDSYVLIPPSVRPEGHYRMTGPVHPLTNTHWLVEHLHDFVLAERDRRKRRNEARIARGLSEETATKLQEWYDQVSWEDLLGPFGWTLHINDKCGCPILSRPGGSSPKSATGHVPGCDAGRYSDEDPPIHFWTDTPGPEISAKLAEVGGKTLSKLQLFEALHGHATAGEALNELFGALPGFSDVQRINGEFGMLVPQAPDEDMPNAPEGLGTSTARAADADAASSVFPGMATSGTATAAPSGVATAAPAPAPATAAPSGAATAPASPAVPSGTASSVFSGMATPGPAPTPASQVAPSAPSAPLSTSPWEPDPTPDPGTGPWAPSPAPHTGNGAGGTAPWYAAPGAPSTAPAAGAVFPGAADTGSTLPFGITEEDLRDACIFDSDDEDEGVDPSDEELADAATVTPPAQRDVMGNPVHLRPMASLRPPGGEEAPPPVFKALAELQGRPEPEFLIKGWLPHRALSAVIGAPNAGKSTAIVDIMCTMAKRPLGGQVYNSWHKLLTKHVKVGYVCGEGLDGVLDRVAAWEKAHNASVQDNLVMTEDPFMLKNSDANWDRFAENVISAGVQVVVFDTLASMNVGVDENSAQEMGAIIARLLRLVHICGVAVILVHHTTRDTRHARGSTALYGALSCEMLIEEVEDSELSEDRAKRFKDQGIKPRRMVITKQKDATYADPVDMTIVSAECPPRPGQEDTPRDFGATETRTAGVMGDADGKIVPEIVKVSFTDHAVTRQGSTEAEVIDLARTLVDRVVTSAAGRDSVRSLNDVTDSALRRSLAVSTKTRMRADEFAELYRKAKRYALDHGALRVEGTHLIPNVSHRVRNDRDATREAVLARLNQGRAAGTEQEPAAGTFNQPPATEQPAQDTPAQDPQAPGPVTPEQVNPDPAGPDATTATDTPEQVNPAPAGPADPDATEQVNPAPAVPADPDATEQVNPAPDAPVSPVAGIFGQVPSAEQGPDTTQDQQAPPARFGPLIVPPSSGIGSAMSGPEWDVPVPSDFDADGPGDEAPPWD